jgi:hypothetical protein
MTIENLTDRVYVFPKVMNFKEAIECALQEPTLLDALTLIAVWDTERSIRQARRYFVTGETNPDGMGWETCFRVCFKAVMQKWTEREKLDEVV